MMRELMMSVGPFHHKSKFFNEFVSPFCDKLSAVLCFDVISFTVAILLVYKRLDEDKLAGNETATLVFHDKDFVSLIRLHYHQ